MRATPATSPAFVHRPETRCMAKRVAAIQSNYVPWKGYFDVINVVDEFILLDEVQYTKRDWRNRNKIKSNQGTQWLTVPVAVKGSFHQRIDETRIAEPAWADRHWRTLTHVYRRAACYDEVAPRLEAVYADARFERLSELNRTLLETVAGILGITTTLTWSTEYETTGTRGERILELCLAARADEYVSGPSARSYMDEAEFERHGIRVLWCNYDDYPPYPQFSEPFEHGVSILDLLFHTGSDAPHYMKTFGGDDGGFV
jgi:hypothetical protein